MTAYWFLAFADGIAALAMVVILARLFVEYARDLLTTRTLLVGGFLFACIFGLFVAGIQMLVKGS